MSPDLWFPIISSIAWLVLCGAALASCRLNWSRMAEMALVWLLIFFGFYVVVEWFMTAQSAASVLV